MCFYTPIWYFVAVEYCHLVCYVAPLIQVYGKKNTDIAKTFGQGRGSD